MHDMAELNYAKFGTGSRKLVIIPGLSMAKVTDNPAALGKTFEIFGKEWTVYLIDRPVRRSAQPHKGNRMSDLCSWGTQ